jgi:hypothetical protein
MDYRRVQGLFCGALTFGNQWRSYGESLLDVLLRAGFHGAAKPGDRLRPSRIVWMSGVSGVTFSHGTHQKPVSRPELSWRQASPNNRRAYHNFMMSQGKQPEAVSMSIALKLTRTQRQFNGLVVLQYSEYPVQ